MYGWATGWMAPRHIEGGWHTISALGFDDEAVDGRRPLVSCRAFLKAPDLGGLIRIPTRSPPQSMDVEKQGVGRVGPPLPLRKRRIV